MQKDIIEKIDLLVKMSDTSSNYETLNEEIGQLDTQIEEQKNRVRNLKKSISENTYIKASDRIIDENVKIGIENKIQYYEESLATIKEQVEGTLLEEKNVHSSIVSLEEEQKQLNQFLASLELKLKTIGHKDKGIYQFYEELIESTKKDLEQNRSLLHETQNTYQQICDKLDQFGNRREDLEQKLEKENQRLEEINQFLSTPSSYIDQKAKQRDEKLVDKLTTELEELERRRLEILTDPAYIAHDAILLMMDDDVTATLEKVKELVTIVQTKPFMEYNKAELDELLENATNERDGLANQIENKIYENKEMNVIEARLGFLADTKKEVENSIRELEEEIRDIDVTKVKKLMTLVDEAKKGRESLKRDIEDYKQVISSNKEFKTPKKEASLRAALKKKEEEYSSVDKMVLAFEKDLENLVIYSRKLEEDRLEDLRELLEKIESEIKELHKNQILIKSSKDILAVERDKEKLKKLNDDVLAIAHRREFDKKPDELYDEIELLLGSMKVEDPAKNFSLKKDDFVDLNEYRIDLNSDEKNDSVKEEMVLDNLESESIPEPISLEETKELDTIETVTPIEPVLTEENDDSIIFDSEPDVKDEEKSKDSKETSEILKVPDEKDKVERYKVIRVEPLSLENEEVEQLDIDASKNSDEDYISFNNLLEGDDENEDTN